MPSRAGAYQQQQQRRCWMEVLRQVASTLASSPLLARLAVVEQAHAARALLPNCVPDLHHSLVRRGRPCRRHGRAGERAWWFREVFGPPGCMGTSSSACSMHSVAVAPLPQPPSRLRALQEAAVAAQHLCRRVAGAGVEGGAGVDDGDVVGASAADHKGELQLRQQAAKGWSRGGWRGRRALQRHTGWRAGWRAARVHSSALLTTWQQNSSAAPVDSS